MKVWIKTKCCYKIITNHHRLHRYSDRWICDCPFESRGCSDRCECELLVPTFLYYHTDISKKFLILKDGIRLEHAQNIKNECTIHLYSRKRYNYGNTCFKVDVNGLDVRPTRELGEFFCLNDISSDKLKYKGFKDL